MGLGISLPSVPSPIKSVSNFVSDAVKSVGSVTYDAVKLVWNDAVAPLIQDVFAFFGIEGEYVVFTQKSSDLFFGTNTTEK